jgi:hypothetical protein
LANRPGWHQCGIKPTCRSSSEPWIVIRTEKATTAKLALQGGGVQVANKDQALRHKSLAANTYARTAFVMEIGDRLATLGSPPSKHDLLQTLSRVR